MRSETLFLCLLAFGFALAKQPGIMLMTDPTFKPYIIKGEDAEDGAFPYMLSLNYVTKEKHACGASILTKNYALTAAHCCEALKNTEMYLYSGSNSLSSGGTKHRIDSHEIHPLYSPPDNWIYDACVIKVKDPFVFGEKVAQITIPPLNYPVKNGEFLNVTGWGLTALESDDIPDKLQLGRNFIAMSQRKCAKLTRLNHPSFLCALPGKRGAGVCNGDSGSPLVKGNIQVGIASFVFMPCGGPLPDFYARVPVFTDWIEKAVGDQAKDLKRPQ